MPLAAQNTSDPTTVDRGLLGEKSLPVLLYFEPGTRLEEVAAARGASYSPPLLRIHPGIREMATKRTAAIPR